MEFFRETSNALRDTGRRKMVEPAEEPQIFAAGKAGIEAEIAAGVVTELTTDAARIENGVVSCDFGAALRREKKRGENPEERGFAGAVCSHQRQGFARTHFEGYAGERCDRWFFEWLEKRAPAAPRGRK